MEYFYLYLFTRIDTLRETSIVLTVTSIMLFVFSFIIQGAFEEYNTNNSTKFDKFRKVVARVMTFSIIFFVVIPTQKQVAFIITAPMIYNNSDVQETVKGLPKAFNNLLQLGNQYLEETKENTNEK